jgi:hypothetical protein
MLEAFAIVSLGVDGGVQGEAVQFRAQGQRTERRSSRTARPKSSDSRAGIRALGHAALDRGCLEQGQQALLFGILAERHLALGREQAMAPQEAQDARPDRFHQGFDVCVLEFCCLVKDRTRERIASRVHTVQDEGVKVST